MDPSFCLWCLQRHSWSVVWAIDPTNMTPPGERWPSHDIVITNIVWKVLHYKMVGVEHYNAQTVWAMKGGVGCAIKGRGVYD